MDLTDSLFRELGCKPTYRESDARYSSSSSHEGENFDSSKRVARVLRKVSRPPSDRFKC
jgi:hypothetical protein